MWGVIRVLVADDDAGVRTTLERLVSRQRDMEVVGVACDGVAALALALDLNPDVALLDVRMPRMTGLEVADALAARGAAVAFVFLTADPTLLTGPLPRHSAALVKAVVRSAELVGAIRRAAATAPPRW